MIFLSLECTSIKETRRLLCEITGLFKVITLDRIQLVLEDDLVLDLVESSEITSRQIMISTEMPVFKSLQDSLKDEDFTFEDNVSGKYISFSDSSNNVFIISVRN